MKRKQIVTRFERMRRVKFVLFSCFIAIVSMVIGAGSIFLYLEKQKIDSDKRIEERKKYVYLAKNNINPGEILSDDNLKKVYLECNMPTEYYITEGQLGTMAIIPIEVDVPILRTMCSKGAFSDELREVACEVVSLSDNLMQNDYVDIRLRYPNGEDYVVLSKKSVHNLSSLERQKQGEETCYLWLKEEEILNFSAAIVDAYLYSGSSFYTVKYLEPQLQEASAVTYIPRLETLDMIKQYPEIIGTAKLTLKERLRKELENRLHYFITQEIREIDWPMEKGLGEERKEDINTNPNVDANSYEGTEETGWEEIP
ncbi:MAG TPA: hypothetical protein DHW61_04435 [Lachnoclostridium phytofermentans]|uniref:SAF domain-containing protein n=1 Tax=Lachnoclostridium phytofermentans TaxID=66219 RepID=A0A3D2X416_9FIRM|nr:hypothetical protein [Lachnoclostridium sp.]HCL01654.1 hypothetical protein [Lachnoclostridium phytofermentans]